MVDCIQCLGNKIVMGNETEEAGSRSRKEEEQIRSLGSLVVRYPLELSFVELRLKPVAICFLSSKLFAQP